MINTYMPVLVTVISGISEPCKIKFGRAFLLSSAWISQLQVSDCAYKTVHFK